MMKHTEEETLEHLATVLWNILRLNDPWSEDDLVDILGYIQSSRMKAQTKKWLEEQVAETSARQIQEKTNAKIKRN